MNDDRGVLVNDDVLRDALAVLVVNVRQGDQSVRYKVSDLNNSEMALTLKSHGFREIKADDYKGDEPVVSVSFRAPGLGFAPFGSVLDENWYLPGADMKRTCEILAGIGLTVTNAE